MNSATAVPIAPRHVADVDALARRFAQARPFRHVVIDGFLDAAVAERLPAEFQKQLDDADAALYAGRLGRLRYFITRVSSRARR